MPYVMIVDDARDSIEPLVAYLERTGYLVKLVTDGREALAEIIRHPPHVMVLDLLMPGMDGSELLEVVRSYLRLSMMPVVVLTGAPDSPLVEKVRGMNVHSVLIKGKATLRDVETALRLARHHVPGAPAPD
jgi:CheY-like chemotaxis protein